MTEAASAGQQVPRSMAIVFDAHDPKATPLAGMPSILTPRSGIWELAPEPGPHTRLVRVGRNWNR
jgi:hypothetical protein